VQTFNGMVQYSTIGAQLDLRSIFLYWSWTYEYIRLHYLAYFKIWNACFTLGVRTDVKPKSSCPTHAKIKITPKGLTIGIKASKKKHFTQLIN
jgi:hypothetical protein